MKRLAGVWKRKFMVKPQYLLFLFLFFFLVAYGKPPKSQGRIRTGHREEPPSPPPTAAAATTP